MSDEDVIEKRDLPDQIRGERRVYLPEPEKVKTLKDLRAIVIDTERTLLLT